MVTEMQPVPENVAAASKRALPPGAARANARANRLERRIALVMVLTPLLGSLVAVALLWRHPIGATELLLLVGMYSLCTFGIGIGYHRLASHRSFQTYTPIRVLFAILGSMAGQGPILYWAAIHRRHHKYSDQPDDPHSPHRYGKGLWATLKGFWHVYLGWCSCRKAPIGGTGSPTCCAIAPCSASIGRISRGFSWAWLSRPRSAD